MWHLKDKVASFVTDPFQFQVNTARPIDGITSVRCAADDLAICPLQISAHPPLQHQSEPIDEVYVRRGDLIATYRRASERTVRPQLVWSAAVNDGSLEIDLTIAMQTQLLASDPSLTLVTTARSEEVLMAVGTVEEFEFQDASKDSSDACGLFLFRLPRCGYSYAEMIYPPDFDASRMEYREGRLEHRLICETLEKGVIRKAQLRGMIVPRHQDTELAAAGFQSLRSSAPPLTT